MNKDAQVAIVLDPQSKNERRKIKLRITYNRTWRTFITSAGDLLTKGEFENTNLKKTKTAMKEVERCKSIADDIVKELGGSFSFESFGLKYKELAFNKVKVRKTTDIAAVYSNYFTEHQPKLTYKTEDVYRISLNWILRYKPQCGIEDIDTNFLFGLQEYIKKQYHKREVENNKGDKSKPINDISINTLAIYYRSIKAICKYAQKKGLLKNDPFVGFRITSAPRQKRALSIDDFRALRNYENGDANVIFAKDMFFLSFLLSGANMGDIFALKNKNINNQTLTFVRRKTQKTGINISMKIPDEAMLIIKKYGILSPRKPNSYIFPFYWGVDEDDARRIDMRRHDTIKKINDGLSVICNDLGIEHITTYHARHTFATFCRDYGQLEPAQISKMLGHSSEKTTSIYLDSLTTDVQEKSKNFLDEIMKKTK